MNRFYENNPAECQRVEAQLTDYLDNTLTARQMLDVEKHLGACAECATLCRETQATVRLLRSAEVYDTSHDFMAKLHARLDGLEPEPQRTGGLSLALRDWFVNVRRALRVHRVPALSLGVASVAVFVLIGASVFYPSTPEHLVEAAGAPASEVRAVTAQSLKTNVALAASNPFDDPVAANLEAHSALKDRPASETE